MSLARRKELVAPQVAEIHRRSASNVLVLHGTKGGRDQVALSFHSARPNPAGSYCKFDCIHEEDRLRSAMRTWITRDGCTSEPAALLGDRDCTLFVDSVEVLSQECQRLLLALLKRLAETSAAGRSRPIGRLIAGSGTDLEHEVAAGRFLPQLYDALNKVRVVLAGAAFRHGGSIRCR